MIRIFILSIIFSLGSLAGCGGADTFSSFDMKKSSKSKKSKKGKKSKKKTKKSKASGSKKGITTEHGLKGVKQTACGLKLPAINTLAKKKIYYAAVHNKFFKDGAACGETYELTVGGTCYENHTSKCTKSGQHAPLSMYGKGSFDTKVTVMIADECTTCVSSTMHFDLGNHVFGSGPLGKMRKFVEKNLQKVKQAKTKKTGQPNNLYLKSVTKKGCASNVTFGHWLKGKGTCIKKVGPVK